MAWWWPLRPKHVVIFINEIMTEIWVCFFLSSITQRDAVYKIKKKKERERSSWGHGLPPLAARSLTLHTYVLQQRHCVLLCSYTTLVSVFHICHFRACFVYHDKPYEYPIRWDESRINYSFFGLLNPHILLTPKLYRDANCCFISFQLKEEILVSGVFRLGRQCI